MSEKLTVETLAKRTGMANVEVMDLSRRAGIVFESPKSEISQEQHAKLQEYLSRNSSESSKKTLSLSGGSKRTKLGLGGTSGPNIVRKRTITQTRNVEALDRQAIKQRELQENVAKSGGAAEAKVEDESSVEKNIRGLKVRTNADKLAGAVAKKPLLESDSGVSKTITRETPLERPRVSGVVPNLDVLHKKSPAKKPPNKATATKEAAAPIKAEDKKTGREYGVARKPEGISKDPVRSAEKKSRRGKVADSGTRKEEKSVEELKLNEFQRRNAESKEQKRTEPLTSTLLTQGFNLPTSQATKSIKIAEMVQVGELAHLMGIKVGQLIKELMKLKVMATVTQSIDFDTAEIVANVFGVEVMRKEVVSLEELAVGDGEEALPSEPRPPVITVMGHVDHGKTSLLDYIRRTKVVEGESGGITQHIGAYHVRNKKHGMTFLDTPGHAAFTAMRARGAQVTDIVILVVAADDKVMPQTIEAIQHARAAKVPIVVALNKIDRPEADSDRLINELATHELVPESWGGDTQFVKVSAHSGEGIDELLEAVMLQAEMLELTAPTQGRARGVVIESWLDKNRGPLATVLVKQGVLARGAYLIAGTAFGRVKRMQDERGENISSANPSMPVEILGLSGVPEAGDEVLEVANERAARDLIAERLEAHKIKTQPVRQKAVDPFSNEPQAKVLHLVVKADTQGSVGAIIHALGELENDQLELNIVLAGVGGITESDVSIAHATGARVVGFNVRAERNAESYCAKEGVQLKYYSIIYELIEEVDNVLHGLLDPIIEEKILGIAEVRDVFSVSKFGKIAGCMVVDGTVFRNKPIRVLRENVVIFEGELESLKRFKEDAKEVRSGMECGIGVKNYKDVKAGDKIEVFSRIEKKPTRD